MTLDQAYELANNLGREGRWSEAESLCRQVLASVGGQREFTEMLAFLCHRAGKTDEAIALLSQLIAADPCRIDPYINLGVILSSRRSFAQAVAAYRQAISIRPDLPIVHFNLANALNEMGDKSGAIEAYRNAIALRPDYFEARANVGNLLRSEKRFEEALTEFRAVCALQPNLPGVHNDLANVLRDQGRMDEAVAAYQKSLALDPGHADALFNLANAQKNSGDLANAIENYRKLTTLRPKDAEAFHDLGVALMDDARHDAAIEALRNAIALDPELAEAWLNLAIVYRGKGNLDDAIGACERALSIRSDFPAASNNLANLLKEVGRLDEAVQRLRGALQNHHDPLIAGNLLYTEHFLPDDDPKPLLAHHLEWNAQYARPRMPAVVRHHNDPDPTRRLRVGYVSPDLREHPIGRFLLPLLGDHDHQRYEIFCYADLSRGDGVTEQLKQQADVWRNVAGLSDEALAQRVMDDKVDILVDLSLFTAGSRLLVFARKPAPVQATYLAYASTSGIEAMDARISDIYLDPPTPGRDALYSEKTYRLPHCYWCYAPADNVPEVSPPPAQAKGYVTFGCLNNFSKVTPRMIGIWCDVLHAVPESRLRIHTFEGSHRPRIRHGFESAGVDGTRIEFVGRLPLVAYFQQYDEIDIALDTFPYAGGTTSCDALWMGVPIVSRFGQTAISRAGLSILSNVGLGELVAESMEQYVSIAAGLAGELPRLKELRATMRSRLRGSPLMDAAGFARDIESAYRRMWQSWCERQRAAI